MRGSEAEGRDFSYREGGELREKVELMGARGSAGAKVSKSG